MPWKSRCSAAQSRLSAAHAVPPSYCLSSGVADRFWRQTRRLGWWGVAYVESVLRLSDWYASAKPDGPRTPPPLPARPHARTPAVSSRPLSLGGIDGGNLLGFLATLGALRVCTEHLDPDCKLSWDQTGSAFRPVLHTVPLTEGEWTDRLAAALARGAADHPVRQWELWSGKAPGPCRGDFDTSRQEADAGSRAKADFLAAIGSDLSRRVPFDSPLRAPREDYMLGNLRTLLGDGQSEKEIAAGLSAPLGAALFRAWTYSDPLDNRSLKFDPAEDLRYALRWANPSGDPSRKRRGNMLGANRLAVEALPLFTGVTRQADFATVACRRSDGGWHLTWPLWRPPLGLDTIRSLLASASLAAEDPGRELERGVLAVYQCRRETVGKTHSLHAGQTARLFREHGGGGGGCRGCSCCLTIQYLTPAAWRPTPPSAGSRSPPSAEPPPLKAVTRPADFRADEARPY